MRAGSTDIASPDDRLLLWLDRHTGFYFGLVVAGVPALLLFVFDNARHQRNCQKGTEPIPL